MKNQNIIWMLLMICSSTIFAQESTRKFASLQVIVTDSATKKPIEFATVTIESNLYKKSKYTNQNGEALFVSLMPETYFLLVNITNYQKIKVDLDLKEGEKNLKKVSLIKSSQISIEKHTDKEKSTPIINTIQGITRSCFGESSRDYFKDSILGNIDSGKEGSFSNDNGISNHQNENNQGDSLKKSCCIRICLRNVSDKPFNPILRAPNPSINMIAAYQRGVDSRNGEVPSIRGSRPENTAYYLDGVRIANPLNESNFFK